MQQVSGCQFRTVHRQHQEGLERDMVVGSRACRLVWKAPGDLRDTPGVRHAAVAGREEALSAWNGDAESSAADCLLLDFHQHGRAAVFHSAADFRGLIARLGVARCAVPEARRLG